MFRKKKIIQENSPSYLESNSEATNKLQVEEERKEQKEEVELAYEKRREAERQRVEEERNMSTMQKRKRARQEKRAIVKENLAQMDTFWQKFNYILYYYKLHFIIGVALVIGIGYFTYTQVTARDDIFYCAYLNDTYNEDFINNMEQKVGARISFNEKKEEVLVEETDVKIEENEIGYYGDDTGLQKLFYYISGNVVDAFLCEKDKTDWFAGDNNFIDLEKELPKDILEKVKPYLYYCTDKSGEKHAYGISIKDTKFFKKSKSNLKDPAISIMMNSSHVDNAYQAIRAIFEIPDSQE